MGEVHMIDTQTLQTLFQLPLYAVSIRATLVDFGDQQDLIALRLKGALQFHLDIAVLAVGVAVAWGAVEIVDSQFQRQMQDTLRLVRQAAIQRGCSETEQRNLLFGAS